MSQDNKVVEKADSLTKEEIMNAYRDSSFVRAKKSRAAFLSSLDSIDSDSSFVFDIRRMYFREMPDISRFTHITEINAERNQLSDFRVKTKNLKHIKYINISKLIF